MLRLRGWSPPALILLTAALFLGGCNVFDASSFRPDTVDVLVADANTALTNGNASRAVHLLERALEKDSTSIRVRVALGNALYAREGLDIFTVRTAAEHLAALSGGSDSSAATRSLGVQNVCTDRAKPGAVPGRYESISLDANPVRRLVGRSSVVERVHHLVVRGVLGQRSEAFSSTPPDVRRKGLLIGAVTEVASSVIDIRTVFDATGGTLYLDREAQPQRAFVACAGTNDQLDEEHDVLCALEAAAHRGVQWLQDRTPPSGEEQGSVLTGRLQDLADAAGARIDCS